MCTQIVDHFTCGYVISRDPNNLIPCAKNCGKAKGKPGIRDAERRSDACGREKERDIGRIWVILNEVLGVCICV